MRRRLAPLVLLLAVPAGVASPATAAGTAVPDRIQAFCGGFQPLALRCGVTITTAAGRPRPTGLVLFTTRAPWSFPLGLCRLFTIPGPPGSGDSATCTTPDLRRFLPAGLAGTPEVARDVPIRVTYVGDRRYQRRCFGATLELRPVPPLPPGAPPIGTVDDGSGPAPVVRRARLRADGLAFSLSRPGTALVMVEQRRGREWEAVRSVALRSGPAGSRAARWRPPLAPGRYRVVTVTGGPTGGIGQAAVRELRVPGRR
jgi:hypothetical protein